MKTIQLYEDGDSQQPIGYESYEASLVDKTNWSVKNDGSKFATRFHNAIIRTSNTITLKINSTSNDGITIASTDGLEIHDMTINDLFITNTGTAAVKIFLY